MTTPNKSVIKDNIEFVRNLKTCCRQWNRISQIPSTNYFKKNYPSYKITLSRPMHTNNNTRAEEKNRHKERELICCDRFDDERFIKLLNDIYRSSNLFINHFSARLKVISKTRMNSKIIKRYDQAQTPYTRTMKLLTNNRGKKALRARHEKLNPFLLKKNKKGTEESFFAES